MPVVRGMQRPQNTVQIVERKHGDLIGTDEFNVEAKSAPYRKGVAQPVHLVLGIGQPKGLAALPRDRLTCFGFKHPRIEVDVVIDAFSEA